MQQGQIMTNSLFDMSLSAHLELFGALQTMRPAVEAAAERLGAALGAGGKVLIAGNGALRRTLSTLQQSLWGAFSATARRWPASP